MDLKAANIGLWASGTRSAIEAQFTADWAILLDAMSADLPIFCPWSENQYGGGQDGRQAGQEVPTLHIYIVSVQFNSTDFFNGY